MVSNIGGFEYNQNKCDKLLKLARVIRFSHFGNMQNLLEYRLIKIYREVYDHGMDIFIRVCRNRNG